MKDPTFDDDIVQDYLAECREHLATIETDLLEVERGGDDIDEVVVNRVFRAAHSIKGGAGFFGLATIRELAHKTENVLDMIRSRQMQPSSEVVSILLLAFDKLRELVADYRASGQADISEFVQALTGLAKENLPANERQSVTEKVQIPLPDAGRLIAVSAFDLSQARKGGKCVYLIVYDLIHDVQRKGKTPYQVVKALMACGSILETVFDLASAGTLDEEPSNRLTLEVLYASVLKTDLIGEVVDAPPDRVFVVEQNGSLKSMDATETVSPAAPSEPDPPKVAVPTTPIPPTVKPEAPAKPTPTAATPSDTTVRLNVTLLDSLMTLAGELVLSRNQLNESLARQDERGIRFGAQRVSLVTSELQEVVTLTRMQPLGGLFGKFTRLVRDLAKELGKEVQLKVEGADVEIDKTILEGLSDPLTHMVRNSVDHGIETPEAREAAGKPRTGTVTLKACHQAGQVLIEISDDGKGLAVEKVAASALAKGLVTSERLQSMTDRDRLGLIFLPGVSTAEKVSNVSGRGVGMDVVKTNLDKLGGKVEIESAPGRGASFRIKLPLTLAIIPSLLISHGAERFAIPQVNVGELIRIPAAQVKQRTDRSGDGEVLILRDRLVPLLDLADALGIPRTDRTGQAVNIVLVDTGVFEYGLVVERLHDTVEIVVKPLGRHVQGIRDYAGATILGDGHVALILDVSGLATRAGLSISRVEKMTRQAASQSSVNGEMHSLLLFQNGPVETCALPIELVSRIERIRPAQIEHVGGRRTMQYRGASLPLVALRDVASVDDFSEEQRLAVIVFDKGARPLGLLAAEPIDMVEAALALDQVTLRQRGVAGSAVIRGRTTLMVDIFEVADTVLPDTSEAQPSFAATPDHSGESPVTVLLAEDSDFFRSQIKRMIEAVGYRVLAAEDGQAAWELLDRHADEVQVVATDIEMPRMDGLSFTRQIRADSRFTELPVIALSSLAGEEEIARGFAAGVSEYQVKLDEDQLLDSIRKAVSRSGELASA